MTKPAEQHTQPAGAIRGSKTFLRILLTAGVLVRVNVGRDYSNYLSSSFRAQTHTPAPIDTSSWSDAEQREYTYLTAIKGPVGDGRTWPMCQHYTCEKWSENSDRCGHHSRDDYALGTFVEFENGTVVARAKGPGPPCCREILRDMYVELAEVFAERHIKFQASYGTLLGAVRDGDILPWTADMDLAMEEEDLANAVGLTVGAMLHRIPLNTTSADTALRRALFDKGIVIHYSAAGLGRACPGSRFKKRALSRGGWATRAPQQSPMLDPYPWMPPYWRVKPYVDLYTFGPSRKGHNYTWMWPCTLSKDDTHPLHQAPGSNEMKGLKSHAAASLCSKNGGVYAELPHICFPGPTNSTNILNTIYGMDWRVPKREAHGSNAGCLLGRN